MMKSMTDNIKLAQEVGYKLAQEVGYKKALNDAVDKLKVYFEEKSEVKRYEIMEILFDLNSNYKK